MNVSDFFGINVFDDKLMRKRLPKDIYKKFKKTITSSNSLDVDIANVVANAMKDWAIEKGATHYCHWFQPLSGRTAEKHDSFIESTRYGDIVLEFSGKQLIQGEPDASSFPNGGLRATFEARGYTAWDPTSPAFIKGTTLYIPTAFCSYTGDALDTKTPLLKSMEALNKQALRVLRLMGDKETKKVDTTVGPEQEYFLVDKDLYQKRQDLIITGRTLYGAPAPKGQELDDHYYGNIRENIAEFMRELDEELWKLGVFSKTKHNEAAPGQHELAPIYNITNIAVDHNQIVMDTLTSVANRHKLVCLLHPKPFVGVNGSGKHNNWSMSTEKGNLLNPGQTPHENKQFLLFLSTVIAAIDEYAPILRLSAASAGNDLRLGGYEAPPAVISIFLGSQLSDIVEQIKASDLKTSKQSSLLELNVAALPKLPKDVTDRNRTSPFAFTGEKFEFRMCSSAGSIASPNIILNTIVAEHLMRIANRLEKASDVNNELMTIISDNINEHSRIIFDGDGYSREWFEEAKRRGLPFIDSTVDAISEYSKDYSIDLFTKHGIFTKEEIFARTEIMYQEYYKTIRIEAKTMVSMAKKEILPAVMKYIGKISKYSNELKKFNNQSIKYFEKNIKEILINLQVAERELAGLEEEIEKLEMIKNSKKKARACKELIIPRMDALREPCDNLEGLVSKEFWPFPTYMDLLFSTQ